MTRRDMQPGGQAAPHSGLVRGKVRRHIQDPESRRWTLMVELRGGRLLQDVQPTFRSSGIYSGERPALPPVGSWVLVAFAESDTANDAFALCSFDGHSYGLDQDSPHESVSMHRSGVGKAVTPDGTETTQWPGGDEWIAGPGAGYEFQVRNEEFKLYKPKLPPRPLRFILNAVRSGLLLKARLIGGMEVVADAAKRFILLKVGEEDYLRVEPGRIRAHTDAMVVGEHEQNAAAVARWPETEATLEALARELQQVKHALVKEQAHRRRIQAQIEIITTYEPMLPIKPPVLAVPWLPVPLVTPQGKDGALTPFPGGIQVVHAGAKSLFTE